MGTMNTNLTRRGALRRGVAAGTLLGMGDLSFLKTLSPVSAAETKLDTDSVQLDPSIAPIVRLLEETPRERVLEEFGARIQQGLSYREVLAALLLAGVKNVEPRPNVGFKFHSVLVVNSAHLASMSSAPKHRWLPIFWALDYYKSAAARDVAERGDWTMAAANESRLPTGAQAASKFRDAMESWDEAAVDAAVTALARTAGANEIYEMFFRYGARDYRSIGHKAIYVANSWRTLQCIGWRHSEPVLRSLAYALLMHEGGNPANRDAEADRPFRRNVELIQRIRSDWRDGKTDSGATEALLETWRTASPEEASDAVVDCLNRGVSPQSIWDALHLGASELLMRKPEIVSLHSVTTTNALFFAYQSAAQEETRQLMMLQNAAFLTLFRKSMGLNNANQIVLTDLPQEDLAKSGKAPLDEIFGELRQDPQSAARKTLGFLNNSGDAADLIDHARMLVFTKGRDAHDYKFSSAILEDYYHVSPQWRNLYLAGNIFKLRGSTENDNALVDRARSALS